MTDVSLFVFGGDLVVLVQRTSLISLLHTVIAVGHVIGAYLILLCFKFGTKLGIATGLVLLRLCSYEFVAVSCRRFI